MFIQTENTPNPHALKFMPGRVLLDEGTMHFYSADEASSSPLARELFAIAGVEEVFIGTDFLSVTKSAGTEWYVIKPMILGALMEHLVANRPVVIMTEASADRDVEDSDIVREIKELLETKIRPAVAMDGGDIRFHSFDKGIVFVEMQGACSGCPSAAGTLKAGVENMLRYYIPEVQEVRAVEK